MKISDMLSGVAPGHSALQRLELAQRRDYAKRLRHANQLAQARLHAMHLARRKRGAGAAAQVVQARGPGLPRF